MEEIMNLLMGEPVYDDNGNIVRRDFGIKNAVFILVIGCIGYSLISGYTVKSGKKKMKGGIYLPNWLTEPSFKPLIALGVLYVVSVILSRLGWPEFLKGNKWYQNKDWDSKKFSDNLETGGIYSGVVAGSVMGLVALGVISLTLFGPEKILKVLLVVGKGLTVLALIALGVAIVILLAYTQRTH